MEGFGGMETEQALGMSLDDLSKQTRAAQGGRPPRSMGGGRGGGGGGPRPRGPPRGGPDGSYTVQVARRVFVGNLSFRTSWQQLKDHFKQVGNVVHADVMQGKGCGIVEFERPEEAAAAIRQLHDTELDGRLVFVREDREDFELKGKRERGGGFQPRGPAPQPFGVGFGGGFGGPQVPGGGLMIGRRVFVNNLSWECTWQDLKDHFGQVGTVLYADVLVDDRTNRSKGCGIVEFDRPEEALNAITTLSNTELKGRPITVREDREDRETQPAGPPPNFQQQSYFQQPFGMGNPRAGMFPGSGGGVGAKQVVVHGIPYAMRWQDLKDLFKQAGYVVRADIAEEEGTKRSKGYGTVCFESADSAQKAIAMFNDMEYEGRMLSVKLDKFA